MAHKVRVAVQNNKDHCGNTGRPHRKAIQEGHTDEIPQMSEEPTSGLQCRAPVFVFDVTESGVVTGEWLIAEVTHKQLCIHRLRNG